MGSWFSKPQEDLPESPSAKPQEDLPEFPFIEPWRDLPENNGEILDYMKSYSPQTVSNLRILLVGPTGAGKSSFINSVHSVVQGRVCGRALTNATGTSFTKKFKTYRISRGKENYCSFVINDTMGLESGTGGVQVEDLILALKGHVEEGYKFIPDRPLTERDVSYKSSPSLDDMVHVLVFVVPVGTIDMLPDEVEKKMEEVRLAASDMDIPQMVILTKVDEACPEAKKDLNNVYRTKLLKQKVDKIHKQLGVQKNCIFLVKNSNAEMEMNDSMNACILLAMKQIIRFGEDFLENYQIPNSGQNLFE